MSGKSPTLTMSTVSALLRPCAVPTSAIGSRWPASSTRGTTARNFPDFSYVAISEYGPRTCPSALSPCFFGLQRKHLDYLLDRWKYGKVKQVRIVAQVNADGSNGFLKASKYIGKYMSKGKFECDSVKECAAERPRVCQSKHLGTKELEPIRRQVLAFDMFGEYDPETLLRPDGTQLSRFRSMRSSRDPAPPGLPRGREDCPPLPAHHP